MHEHRSVHQAGIALHHSVSDPFSIHSTLSRLLLLTVLCLAAALLLVPGIMAQREDAIAQARAGVSANQDWTPYVEMFDGVPMVLVPSGCFLMGNILGSDDERPVHQVCFDAPFWIDQTEVTQGDFARLAGTIPQPLTRFTGDRLPIGRVTWFEASAFCAQRGGRLPTEAEWEYAARGPDWLFYPWGMRFIADNVVYEGNSGGRVAEVMSRPGGVSWVGAHDMAGNVNEWTNSLYQPYPYDADDGREADTGEQQDVVRVRRGGAWDGYPFAQSVGFRMWSPPDSSADGIGFRCARDFKG